MSDIVWAINPRRDSIESVVDRVCSFAADTLGTKNVHWTVASPPELKRLHLTAEEKRNLYLIFKEAVNNAAKHSRCQNASLKILVERGTLVAEIEDDGQGFRSDEPAGNTSRSGRGVTNMLRRAKEIGGKLAFESTESSGTKIILTLPLATYRINGWFRRSRK
jgi:signal transduction histidine kinase